MTDQDKQMSKKTTKSPLESLLGMAEKEEKAQGAVANGVCLYGVPVVGFIDYDIIILRLMGKFIVLYE